MLLKIWKSLKKTAERCFSLLRHMQWMNDDEAFCRKWAKYESKDFVFEVRHELIWTKPWKIEFYDLHRWNGGFVSWNGHDVSSGDGNSENDAWKNMSYAILAYESAKSKEEALVKAELKMRRNLPRGWGNEEYASYYSLSWPPKDIIIVD